MGPEILSSTGAGVWREAPMAFQDSSSVLDKFQSAKFCDDEIAELVPSNIFSPSIYFGDNSN